MDSKVLVEQLLDKWEDRGYSDIRISVWKGLRIYVNIKGIQPFYYALDHRVKGNYKIGSSKLLQRSIFADARVIGFFIYKNCEGLLKEMKDGQTFSRLSK